MKLEELEDIVKDNKIDQFKDILKNRVKIFKNDMKINFNNNYIYQNIIEYGSKDILFAYFDYFIQNNQKCNINKLPQSSKITIDSEVYNRLKNDYHIFFNKRNLVDFVFISKELNDYGFKLIEDSGINIETIFNNYYNRLDNTNLVIFYQKYMPYLIENNFDSVKNVISFINIYNDNISYEFIKYLIENLYKNKKIKEYIESFNNYRSFFDNILFKKIVYNNIENILPVEKVIELYNKNSIPYDKNNISYSIIRNLHYNFYNLNNSELFNLYIKKYKNIVPDYYFEKGNTQIDFVQLKYFYDFHNDIFDEIIENIKSYNYSIFLMLYNLDSIEKIGYDNFNKIFIKHIKLHDILIKHKTINIDDFKKLKFFIDYYLKNSKKNINDLILIINFIYRFDSKDYYEVYKLLKNGFKYINFDEFEKITKKNSIYKDKYYKINEYLLTNFKTVFDYYIPKNKYDNYNVHMFLKSMQNNIKNCQNDSEKYKLLKELKKYIDDLKNLDIYVYFNENNIKLIYNNENIKKDIV